MFCSSKFGVVSPDKCGVHCWRMMMTKNPQMTWWIVRQKCPKSDQQIFKFMNFALVNQNFSAIFQHIHISYRWWKKSCTSCKVVYQFITLFTGFFTSQDFFHQQYHHHLLVSSPAISQGASVAWIISPRHFADVGHWWERLNLTIFFLAMAP